MTAPKPIRPTYRDSLIAAYMEKRSLLLQIFTARLGDAHWAEDVVQDLFIRISTSEISGEVGNPAGYLFRAASHIAINQRRSQDSERLRGRLWQADQADWLGPYAVSSGQDALTTLIDADARKRLAGAVEALDEPARTMLRLNRFEGLTQPQIAERLGVSVSTVEKKLSAALRQLIRQLPDRDVC